MQASDFIRKWRGAELTERAASQSHFVDLCRVLEEPTPSDADPKGEWYAFEKGALKTGGGDGWADVWKRGCFAWEYKGKRKNLGEAYVQLQRYAVALENPPLLVVSDMERFRIHTNWTNTVQEVIEFPLEELADERQRRILKQAFSETEVEALKPGKTRQELTEDVALKFAEIAGQLRGRGHDPQLVAHFVNRMLFCMFAEDVNLLPGHMFRRMLKASVADPDAFVENAKQLFAAMGKGGRVGFEPVDWFNGGIFDDDSVLPLEEAEIKEALAAAEQDWSNIDPSIMGTLFERGLDPGKRGQLGAHYTDRDKIMMIVNPVIVEPLQREWTKTRAEIETLIERYQKHKDKSQRTKAYNDAMSLHQGFIERLRSFRVLDPACGSGNFLYLSLQALKDIEHKANLEAEQLGLPFVFPSVGPECVKGLEINPFAAELARVSVWIGEIQWMLRHGFSVAKKPILKNLDTIECRDAVLTDVGKAANWPKANVVVGNPPFLGNKKMKRVLKDDYVSTLRKAYDGRVPAGADLVIYWFQHAYELVSGNNIEAAGLVGTQAIRRGASRKVLDKVTKTGRIFDAWDDEEWTVDGADVRVSLVCFDNKRESGEVRLDGENVSRISSDLVASEETEVPPAIAENLGVCFQGTISGGPFEIDGTLARQWIKTSGNPNGRPNADVLRPWRNADDITGACSDTWIILFPDKMTEAESAKYEAPFKHLKAAWKRENDRRAKEGEKPLRDGEEKTSGRWWILQRSRPKLRAALGSLNRYIATPRVGKHRTFVWLDKSIIPDTRLVVIARGDDVTFGILQSRAHRLWSLRYGARHGVGNDPEYVHTRTFETFPFPEGFGPKFPIASFAANKAAYAIAEAARSLDQQRRLWLEPPELVRIEKEIVKDFPPRLLPVSDAAALQLRQRTLTALYNERRDWLTNAHAALDAAVEQAYGWPAGLDDAEVLSKLLELSRNTALVEEEEEETA